MSPARDALAHPVARRARRARRAGVVSLAVTGLVACSGDQVRYQQRATIPPTPTAASAVLYLVGDGGEVNADREAVLAHLAADIEEVARGGAGPPVVVAFLGDNIYDEGAPAERIPEDMEKLSGQVHAIGTAPNVHGVFVPGNHDWADGGSVPDGREAIARQRAWVDDLASDYDVRFLPDDGCPGPATEDIGDAARLVFVDTEWLLRAPEGECGTADDFYARLAEQLRTAGGRPVVVLSHHPLASGGPHGGNVGLFQRGPLVYFLASKSGAIRQDLHSPAYTAMREGFAEAIARSGAPPLVHAAGHDHTLQVIRLAAPDEPRYQIVSGALAKTESVDRIEGTRYASDGFGYVRLEFAGARVRLVVFRREADGGPVSAVFSCFLSQEAPSTECPEAPLAAGI